MTNVTPLVQPPLEDLRNALQIADAWAPQWSHPADMEQREAWYSVARLIRHALDQLGEPNAAMCAAVARMFAQHHPLTETLETPEDVARYVRDCAAILLSAQVKGTL